MTLHVIDEAFSVCHIPDAAMADLRVPFTFLSCTDEEISLVCPTRCAPEGCTAREDGWRGFRIQGVLDFSLIGILARISRLLAEGGVGIFAISTYNTDYILTKGGSFGRALEILAQNGYMIEGETTL